MCAKSVKPEPVKPVGTTGHVWDGIEELNNPLPRWWVWVFYLTILFSVGYCIAYPAWPMLHSATRGVLGYSTRGALEQDIAVVDARNADIKARLVATDLSAIPADPDLQQFAVSAGAAVFRTNCSTCHGSGAAGVAASGYPNLLDDDWLWGGRIEDIHLTVTHGIRNAVDGEARYSEMPKFGVDELLDKDQINQVVEHVLAISGQDHDQALATGGAPVYAEHCAGCHGETGIGNRDLGAPNLTDAIWLYGGARAEIENTVTYSRFGVMPPWGYAAPGVTPRLTEDQIRAVSVYIHSLGGGE